MFVVIHGNPADGFAYVGPFADADAATHYADAEVTHDNWWVVQLEAPTHAEEDAADLAAARRAQTAGEYVTLEEAFGDDA